MVAEERDGATRYRLLETVRQYAQDRLREGGGEAERRSRHLAYFVALAEEAEGQLMRADQQSWLDRLEVEHDNLRAALAWSSVAGADAAGGLKLAGALWRFWFVRGYVVEGRARLARLLATPPTEQGAVARAKALHGAAALAFEQGDYSDAWVLCDQSLALRRKLGDRRGVATSLNNLANVALEQGDYPSARALYDESLVTFRELDDQWGVAVSLNNLGLVAYEQGDYSAARARHSQSLAIRRELKDKWGIAASLNNLGTVAHADGDYPSAWALHGESLAIRRELGDRSVIAESLEGLAAVAFNLARPSQAARTWGAAERLREETARPLAPMDRARYNNQVAAARAAMGDDAAFDLAWHIGRAMTLEEALRSALQECES